MAFVEQHQGLGVALPGPPIKARRSPQKVVVGIEAFSRLAPRALDFGLLQFWGHRTDHARCDLVLQIEDILERTGSAQAACPRSDRSPPMLLLGLIDTLLFLGRQQLSANAT